MVPADLIPTSQQEEGARIVAVEMFVPVPWLHPDAGSLGTECIV